METTINMTSVPTKVTQAVAFLHLKHKSVSLSGSPQRLGRWHVRYQSETGNAWAFSRKNIPRGEKVRLLAVENSYSFIPDLNPLYPAIALREGFFTFIDKNPKYLPATVINSPAPIIQGFDGIDDPANNLRVTFEKGGIYEIWISPDEFKMLCAKVRIDGDGQNVTVEKICDSKTMEPFDGKKRFWLMLRATPLMKLQFLG